MPAMRPNAFLKKSPPNKGLKPDKGPLIRRLSHSTGLNSLATSRKGFACGRTKHLYIVLRCTPFILLHMSTSFRSISLQPSLRCEYCCQKIVDSSMSAPLTYLQSQSSVTAPVPVPFPRSSPRCENSTAKAKATSRQMPTCCLLSDMNIVVKRTLIFCCFA